VNMENTWPLPWSGVHVTVYGPFANYKTSPYGVLISKVESFTLFRQVEAKKTITSGIINKRINAACFKT